MQGTFEELAKHLIFWKASATAALLPTIQHFQQSQKTSALADEQGSTESLGIAKALRQYSKRWMQASSAPALSSDAKAGPHKHVPGPCNTRLALLKADSLMLFLVKDLLQ